ncbi:hypothetical protein SKAU_G00021700 [Synaphobranchus kaupii]|uniref:Uncharacterized protein n=1 Tax=Synaphobranchus kaupii TaxID=118154 RepID=A0A9Q1GDT9_SYNKA|nr:hypothetical protein SKAU_G00021700 [Synaphobranchus kaupii]
MGTSLGLDARVHWFGWGGLRWERLCPFIHQSLRGRAAPDVLLIHCGGNDLGRTTSLDLITAMKQDLQDLHCQFPDTEIILSGITQRRRWRAVNPGKINKARNWLPRVLGMEESEVANALIAYTRLADVVGEAEHNEIVGPFVFIFSNQQDMERFLIEIVDHSPLTVAGNHSTFPFSLHWCITLLPTNSSGLLLNSSSLDFACSIFPFRSASFNLKSILARQSLTTTCRSSLDLYARPPG